MSPPAVTLHAVETEDQRAHARSLVTEYLQWVADVASATYGLSFDIDAMVQSDLEDRTKFLAPTGRFYLVQVENKYVGVGCLKRLDDQTAELQRMYVQPHVRGAGAGRRLLQKLLEDARTLGYATVRLESLKALSMAHALYRSEGFVDIDPYSENSMKAYQATASLDAYGRSAVFMELRLAPA
jgi:GNAT superfamily N-acetyltransferase